MFSGALSREVEEALLAEIEGGLGGKHRDGAEGRLGHIKQTLGPMFQAMPKNEQGKLDHGVVRYILHRLFVQRHGWFIQGLRPGGDAWDAVSPTDILHDQVPEQIQSLFETRIGGAGLSLDELAVLAAILEHMIHSEAAERLEFTYRALGHEISESLPRNPTQDTIDVYMSLYIQGANISSMPLDTAMSASEALRQVSQVYPNWNDTIKFTREVQHTVAPGRAEFAFVDVLAVVEEIGERYGRWQDQECRQIKAQMANMGNKRNGRVRLADFYWSAVTHGQWQFSESVDYLRQLGALDESDPTNLQVIIPNYINSPSNCIASSSYYSVCCIDECGDLLGHLEDRLGKPAATAMEIRNIVSAMPSESRAADRELSPLELSRLDEVAEHHGGQIPLHGRLFLQWMHLAYPMECSFPHMSGTTTPMTSSEYLGKTGRKGTSSLKEMKLHIENRTLPQAQGSDEDFCTMWSMDEELISQPTQTGKLPSIVVVPTSHDTSNTETAATGPEGVTDGGSGAASVFRVALLGTALVSTFLSIFRTLRSGISAVAPSGGKAKADWSKCYV